MTEPTGHEPEQPATLEPTPDAQEPADAPEPAAEPETPAAAEAPIWSTSGSVPDPGGAIVPPPPPPSTGVSRKTWIIGLVAALVLIGMASCCALGVLFAYKQLQDSPTEVVEQYLTATRDQDADALENITCEALQTGHGEYGEFGSGVTPDNREFFEGIAWKIGEDREVSPNRHEIEADVTLKAGQNAGTVKLTFVVVKESGWKICGLAD